jgi:Na+-transporting NADH:ubiquinone oxidoreductase subunit E
MGVELNPFVIMIAAALTSNMILSNFLGMCSFIAVSRDLKTANGLGLAVTFVLTFTTVLNHFVHYYILIPLGLEYLRFIVFIIVIAAFVQLLEMIIDRFSPALYISLGIFLPLITVNCAILGGVLFMIIREYTALQGLLFGFGSGAGWWLAIVALAAIRGRLREKDIPPQLNGTGITLIIIGIMAMAFIGFSGMVPVR